MTLSNDLIEPQQWYRWHDRDFAHPGSEHPEPHTLGPDALEPDVLGIEQLHTHSRFHFGDLVVRDRGDDTTETDDPGARFRLRGSSDVSITFRCHGIVQIYGEQFTMEQLAEDESLLTLSVRVFVGDAGPGAEIAAQFMTGDFAGLDTVDPSAALSDFELRARAEALAFVQRGHGGIDAAALSRQLMVSQRRLNRAFRNTGNSVRATLRCG